MKELDKLRIEVENCKRCDLWKVRLKPVFGEGPEDAKIMLVGLGPGYQENRQGRPFVGPAGKLLDSLLSLAGLGREEVYITNVMKCYLPDNRATEEQLKACTPYLDRQIELIRPKVLIALGNVSSSYLLTKFGMRPMSMGRMHRTIYRASTIFGEFVIIPMYHPASALRNPALKEVVKGDWEALKDGLSPFL